MSSDPAGGADAGGPAPGGWGDVLRTPMRGGAALPAAILVAAAAATAWAEGGIGDDEMRVRRMTQAFVVLPSVVVLAIAARRVTICTIQGDRPVPWGRDEADRTSWTQDVTAFLAVVVSAVLPAALLALFVAGLGAPRWASSCAGLLGLVAAASHVPFAIAGTALRDTPFAASWGRTRAAWRANRPAAKSSFLPALAFLGLGALSFVVAAWLVPPFETGRASSDDTLVRNAGRVLVFVLRAGSVWAAFAMFRVAGMLVRDVPEIREVLE